MKYTLTIFSENKPGVLNRISDLLLRRRINIEALTVSTTEQPGISRFTIVAPMENDQVEKIIKQIYKVIEVVNVYASLDRDLIYKELAFYKIKNTDSTKVTNLIKDLKGEIVYTEGNIITIQKTGSEEEIEQMYKVLKPLGITEFVRSGRIAVKKH